MDLQTVLDERAIRDVAVAYCWALDERRFEALADVFTAEATARLGTPDLLEGLDAIVDRVRSALAPLDSSQHVVSTHQVAVDGDSATHRCYLLAQHTRQVETGSPNWMLGGRYEDELVRTPAGWRIAHRTLVSIWTEGNLDVFLGR